MHASVYARQPDVVLNLSCLQLYVQEVVLNEGHVWHQMFASAKLGGQEASVRKVRLILVYKA